MVLREDVILDGQVRKGVFEKIVAGGKLKIWLALITGVLLALLPFQMSAARSGKTAASKKTTGLVSHFAPYPPMVNPIRVGLSCRANICRFAIWAPGFVFLNAMPVFELKAGLPYSIAQGRITELGTGKSYQIPGDARVHVTAQDYRVWANNRWYRGCLELINLNGLVTVINLLDLEDYLLGVVPSEMPASWHAEALKAQAVAARSYASAHLGQNSKWCRSEGFDLVPDVRDQAYKGLAAEAQSTFSAVQLTRGLILKDSGKVKPGFYRAWVGDEYENLNIRKSQVDKKRLEKITGVANIVGVTIKKWDANGNALDIQVMGHKKSREVYGVALAKMLGFSTAGVLDVQEQGPFWIFTYRGPGNGSRGLSQHGANMLAANGWRFDQILQQYYQDNDGKLRLDYVNNFRAMPPPAKSEALKTTSSQSAPALDESGDK